MDLSYLLSNLSIVESICSNLTFSEINNLRISCRLDKIIFRMTLQSSDHFPIVLKYIGSDVNLLYRRIKESGLRKALFRTVIEGCPNSLITILEMGARLVINAQNIFRENALILATKHNHENLVQILLNNNANVNPRVQPGKSALLVASMFGYLPIVKKLVENGANLDVITEHGLTPLMVAVQKGHYLIVQYLLEQGARVNHSFQSALSLARIHNRGKIFRLLLKYDALDY